MNSVVVIAVYKPREGCRDHLHQTLHKHVPVLRKLGLVTDRAPLFLESIKGEAVLEIFEWVSEEAVERAHREERVQAIWEELGRYAEFSKLESLAEAADLFPHFRLTDPASC